MSISLQGFSCRYATFTPGEKLTVGALVEVTADTTVQDANGSFSGVLTALDRGLALVQLGGYARVAYSGNVTHGQLQAKADENGRLTPAENGRRVTVVDLDEAAGMAGILL